MSKVSFSNIRMAIVTEFEKHSGLALLLLILYFKKKFKEMSCLLWLMLLEVGIVKQKVRVYLHVGGGLQVRELTRLGRVTCLSI